MTTEQLAAAVPGDLVEIVGHRVGDGPQTGEILEVLGSGERAHFRIRWEDGRETILFPGSDIALVATRALTP
jgi:hypothetical protein